MLLPCFHRVSRKYRWDIPFGGGGGIAPPLRMLSKGETLRKGGGGIAPNLPCWDTKSPIARRLGGHRWDIVSRWLARYGATKVAKLQAYKLASQSSMELHDPSAFLVTLRTLNLLTICQKIITFFLFAASGGSDPNFLNSVAEEWGCAGPDWPKMVKANNVKGQKPHPKSRGCLKLELLMPSSPRLAFRVLLSTG